MIKYKQKHLVVFLATFNNHLADERRNRLNFAPDINNYDIYIKYFSDLLHIQKSWYSLLVSRIATTCQICPSLEPMNILCYMTKENSGS